MFSASQVLFVELPSLTDRSETVTSGEMNSKLDKIAAQDQRQDQQRWYDHLRTLCAKFMSIDHELDLIQYQVDQDPNELATK